MRSRLAVLYTGQFKERRGEYSSALFVADQQVLAKDILGFASVGAFSLTHHGKWNTMLPRDAFDGWVSALKRGVNGSKPAVVGLYGLLGVAENASTDEIKRAFRQQAKKLHPDVNDSPAAAEQFARVSGAYEALKDPLMRRKYDAVLKWKTMSDHGPVADMTPEVRGTIEDAYGMPMPDLTRPPIRGMVTLDTNRTNRGWHIVNTILEWEPLVVSMITGPSKVDFVAFKSQTMGQDSVKISWRRQ